MGSLNIKNPHTVELIRELATKKGISLVSAITLAVEDKLAEEKAAASQASAPEARYERLMAYAGEFARRVPHPIHSWQIDELLYDEHGLPK
ncbi:type II toxin-antitoxin system VapB family antitoxin [Acidicapsa dinghuensis]|uniref:Type II toxin-antitoxin system VapB family antitoxin n=1 Tax=Acidicapsa dinghuensis TaxID=2218256 RepID=A0ABW1EKJ2_9BACT|nr:type II toxin-antitoxin system VapB family antitoxin [Acidicapsa dinghuensis]